MTPCRFLVAALGGILFATAVARAQTPHNPPRWWRVQDDVTVSLAWDFNTPWQPGTVPPPSLVVAPVWYNPAVTTWTLPGNVGYLGSLAGHTGVLALSSGGAPVTAALALTVDNDPHLNWIKVFWCQFDAYKGAGSEVAAKIREDLADYKRANVTETVEPLANGWERVTIQADLIPQPDDETVDWTLTQNVLGATGIDNLFVNSKCIKYGQDETGDALGDVDGFALPVGSITGSNCTSAAVTEGPAPQFARTYWVGTRASLAGASHQVFQLTQSGSPVTTVAMPDAVAATPLGVTDLCVERVQVTPTLQQSFVYALIDRRPSGPPILRAINAQSALLAPTRDVVLTAFPSLAVVPQQQFGLAFDPAGEFGLGTFWVSDPNGAMYEFNRAGALLQTQPIPAGTVGLGYDHWRGNFYGFTNAVRTLPGGGPVQVNGYELSSYDYQPTGVEFCGDLRIANPGGPPGGIAHGLDCYRRANDEFRLVCLVSIPAQNQTLLYELKGPYRFGFSHLGRAGTAGGPMFTGSTTYALTLSGVPHSVAAVLFAGFSNTTYAGGQLPIDLGGLGWTESTLAIAPDLNTGIVVPTVPGEFRFPLNVPPALSYAPVYFQWILLDGSVASLLAMSQAGKTIAY